jgi:presenilin-like A22 family membrane protease
MFLNKKTEGKLKGSLEDREFQVRDAALLVGLMAVMITLIVFVRQISVIMMVLFLFSYSMLLFTFSYLFSRNRWYVGIVPPAVFILLYVLLRETDVWIYYLSNIYGLVFAVLITLYLATLFTWKTTAVFGVLITIMDIILVLVTKTMVEAASAAMRLSLPVLVSVPLIPLNITDRGILMMSLGLGDFFFAGLLAIQTLKQYGKRYAVLSAVTMTVSFFIFEALILNYQIRAFPGTLMIVCGWVPLVLFKELQKRPQLFQESKRDDS